MTFDYPTTTTTIVPPATHSTSSSSSSSLSMSSSINSAQNRPSWATAHSRARPSLADTSATMSSSSSEPTESRASPECCIHSIPESPPSSPLPLDFCKTDNCHNCQSHEMNLDSKNRRSRSLSEDANGNTISISTADMNHHEYAQSPDTPATMRRNSSPRASSPSNCAAYITDLSKAHKKLASGGVAASSDIKCRPRFTLSTNVNPRPPAYTTTGSTIPPGSTATTTTTSRTSSSTKPSQSKTNQRANKSSTDNDTPFTVEREPSKTSSTKTSSKSRSPTTITMSTTRRVVSTIINVGGQNGDINHRKESTITTTVVAAGKKSNLGLGLTGLGLDCNRTERSGRHHRAKAPTTSTVAPTTGSSGVKDRERKKAVLKPKGTKATIQIKHFTEESDEEEEEQNVLIMSNKDLDSEQEPVAVTDTRSQGTVIVQNSKVSSEEIDCHELEALDRDLIQCNYQLRSEAMPARIHNNAKDYKVSKNVKVSPESMTETLERLVISSPKYSSQPLTGPPLGVDKVCPDNHEQYLALKTGSLVPASAIEISRLGQEKSREDLASISSSGENSTDASYISTPTIKVQEERKVTRRTSILTALRGDLSKNPLTKAKDPAVMMELMMLAKEQRRLSTTSYSDTDYYEENDNSGGHYHDNSGGHYHGNNYESRNSDTSRSSTPINISSSYSVPSATCISFHGKKSFLKLQEMQRNKLKRSQSLNTGARARSSNVDYFNNIHSESVRSHMSPYPLGNPPESSIAKQNNVSSDRLSPSIPTLAVIPPKAANVLRDMGYPLYKSSSSPDLLSTSALSSTSISSYNSTSASTSMTSLSSFQSVSPALSAVSTLSRPTSSMSLHDSFPECLFTGSSPSASPRIPARTSTSPLPWTPSPSRSQTSTPINKPSSSWIAKDAPRTTLYPTESSLLSVPSRNTSRRNSYENVSRQDNYENMSFESHKMNQRQKQHQQQQQYQRQQQDSYPEHGQFWKAMRQEHDSSSDLDISDLEQEASFSSRVHANNYGSAYQNQIMPRVEIDDRSFDAFDYEPCHPYDNYNYRSRQDSTHLDTGVNDNYFSEGPQPIYQLHHQEQAQQQPQARQCRIGREHDISILTKRLANLQLMDSLCPGKLTQNEQVQPTMDSAWGTQIQHLLVHLSEQTDIEEKAPSPNSTASSSSSRPTASSSSIRSGNTLHMGTGAVAGQGANIGVYEMVLTDWIHRLDQVPEGVYKDHPWLKREVDK
ncbi:hypothetical protein BGZ49_010619, partial [Haplosporangium sp. Z 27]